MFPQLFVDLSSELWRQVDGRAMLRGLADYRPIPLQSLQGSLQGRDMIGRESTQEIILEHVVLPEHFVAVKLVEDCGLIPRNIPQADDNRTRKYKYSVLTPFTQV